MCSVLGKVVIIPSSSSHHHHHHRHYHRHQFIIITSHPDVLMLRNVVLYTHYSGEVSNIVDEHFTKALNQTTFSELKGDDADFEDDDFAPEKRQRGRFSLDRRDRLVTEIRLSPHLRSTSLSDGLGNCCDG